MQYCSHGLLSSRAKREDDQLELVDDDFVHVRDVDHLVHRHHILDMAMLQHSDNLNKCVRNYWSGGGELLSSLKDRFYSASVILNQV